MLKKAFRSVVSFAVVLCLLLGMSGNAIALAANYGGAAPEQNKPIKYVSLGDSMANGYGFAGYNQTSNDRNVYDFMTGKGMYGVGAYPTQFEKYLTDLGYEVDHTKLATSAMLAEDLLYLLGGREEFDDGWGGYKDYVGTYTDAELMPYIQNAITEADVITMGIGNASFGAFLLHKITDALGVFGATLEEDEKVDFEDAIAVLELDAEQYALVMQMHDYLVDMLIGKVPAGLVDQYNLNDVVDLLSYTATTYIVNYKLLVEKILEMNPDVEIILVGLLNTTYGMNITDENGNVLLPFGDVMDELFGILNTYMAGLPAVLQAQGLAEDAKLYYAEQPNPKFICQEFESLLNNNWTADDSRLDGAIIRQRNIDAFNGDLASMIGYAVTGAPLTRITLEDVKAYEALDFDALKAQVESKGMGAYWSPWAAFYFAGYISDQQKAIDTILAVSIYLAIEEAVAKSTNTMDIPLTGMMKIAGDLSTVFTGLGTPPTESPDATRQWLVNGLNTEETQGMCKIYGLFKVGNGMSVHPTPKGHDEIAASVIAAYENKHTVQDEIIEKAKLALGVVVDLVAEYYDDAYAYAYANSGEYIAAANTAIDAAIAKLAALDLSESEMTPAFKAEVAGEVEEIIEALTAAKALLNGADVLDQETLVLAVAALEEAGEAVANLEKLLAQAGADVTELVIVPAIEAAIEYVEEVAIPTAIEAVEKVVEEALNYLVEKLEELKTELVAELEKQAEALKAELEGLKAQLENASAELKAEIESAIAEIESAIAEIQAAIAEIEAAIAEIEKAGTEQKAELVAKLKAQVEKLLNDAVAELIAILTDVFNNATHTDYQINENSSYVAIGDNTAYAELLNAYLAEVVTGTDKAGYKYPAATLIQSATIAGAPAAIQSNLAAIAGADLISIGYGNDTFATQAIDAMMAALIEGEFAEYDWVALLGEDGAVYAAEAMAELYSKLVAMGLADVVIPTAKASLADAMMAAVESYIYNVAVYGLYLPEIIAAIQEINPDAQIIVVGMSNPFAGTVFTFEDMAINVGEYVQYVVDAANIYGVTYAVLTENVTFVPAPEAESAVSNQTIEMGLAFVASYIKGEVTFATTEAGNAYIAEQIMNALTVTVETVGLLGDADNDGDVDIYDAQMVLAYVTGDTSKNELIDLTVSDVDADSDVDIYDAQAILAYVTGGTEKLPAE